MMTIEDKEEGDETERPLFWIAGSKDDLRAFPEMVKDVMGFALYQAQKGGKHVAAKPLKGFAEPRSLRLWRTTEEVHFGL